MYRLGHTVDLHIAALTVLTLGRRGTPFALLVFVCGRSFLLQFLLLEARLGDGEEECAFKAVLLAVLTYRGIGVGEDIASV